MDYRNQSDSELYRKLLSLPKIELHRHLEGSWRLKTLGEVASHYEIDLPGYAVDDFRHMVQIMPDDEAGADTFLSKFRPLRTFYRSPQVIQRVAYEAVLDAAAENIIYMELRFTPIALGRLGNYKFDDVIRWVVEATQKAASQTGIEVGLIVSMNRNESVDIGHHVVEAATKYVSEGIVGVDLAGAEHKFPGEPFKPVFDKARAAGMKVTIHAGEWAGPQSIREAIDVLEADRIGHGVRVVEDRELVEELKEKGVPFEVCLTSNVQSGVAKTYETHPLREMYKDGLNTTINTDDPSISAIGLTDEYVLAVKKLNFSTDDIKQNILNAAKVAFLPEDQRTKLVKNLMSALYPASETHKA